MNRSFVLPVFLISTIAGCDSGSPVDPATSPHGAAPIVSLSMGFADSPLSGVVRLRPPAGSGGWRYFVDLNEDRAWDYQGVLERELGFGYRFDSPGIHAIGVRVEGTDTLDFERAVVVNDPSKILVAATGALPSNVDSGFEGITTSPNGVDVFLGAFSGGAIFRVDLASLEVRDMIELGYGIEGLSVSPSGDFLFVAHKYPIASFRLRLPELEPASPSIGPPWQNFYVHALDDDRALFGGEAPLVVYDVTSQRTVAKAQRSNGEEMEYSGHFAISPDGATVVAFDPLRDGVLQVLSLPGLLARAEWSLPDGHWNGALAFASDGKRLFALSNNRLFVLDAETGRLEAEFVGVGRIVSVANPVALSRDGRFLAFDTEFGALIVETARGIPLYRMQGTSSVATDPTVDAGFVLLGVGGLRRITITP